MSIDNNIDFKDHIVQYPNRFKQTIVSPGIVELVPTWIENPAEIIEAGTPVDSELFKKLKQNVTLYQQTFTTTAGQTTITLDRHYLIGQSRVGLYIGGVKQYAVQDYTETSTNVLTMKTPLVGGLKGEAIIFTSSQAIAEDLYEETLAAIEATQAANAAATNANTVYNATFFNFLTPVNTFSAIASTYPNPKLYDAVMVDGAGDANEGKIYRWEGSSWNYKQKVSGGPFATLATQVEKNRIQLNKPKTVEQVIEKMLNKQPVKIVCFGDSVTWGYVPGTGAKTANPYPETLQTLLRDYYGYTGITVYNEGDSGKQSDEFASDTFIARVTSKSPDLVIFMCGINDSRGGTSGGDLVPVSEYKDNIALMTSKLPYPLIFMTPTFYQDNEDRKYRFQQYVSAMREMAKTLNVKLIDLHEIVLKDVEKRELAYKDVAPDNVHFADSYYQKIAEFIFVFGLMPYDITVKSEMFIQPYSPWFRWKTTNNNFFVSSINPLKQNIWLDYNNASFNQLTLYLFVDRTDLALQPVHVSNPSTAPTNSITVNGVSYPIYQAVTNGQTIFKLRGTSIPLTYGLNKIVLNTSTDGGSKTLALYYGMNIIKRSDSVSGKRKLLEGAFPIQSSADGVQKLTKLVTFKENDFTKLSIKFTPTAINSGFAFGTGSALFNGTVKEYPPSVVLHGGSDNVKLFDLKMNDNNAFFANGNLTYAELAVNPARYNMNLENEFTVTLNSTSYVFALNGVTLFTLQKTTLNIGVMDIWGYSINASSCTVNSITAER